MRAGPLSASLFPFVRELTPAGQRELGALRLARAKPNAALLRRGDACGGAYLVETGALRVYYVNAEGREATLYRVAPGGTCVLALSSTLGDAPYPAWASAASRGATIVKVPNASFQRLLDTEPSFRRFVFSALTGNIFELMCALEETASEQMVTRVARYLARRTSEDASDVVEATQMAIASELGTAREVVFRALRVLVGRGLIATGRGRVRVLDRAGLVAAARVLS